MTKPIIGTLSWDDVHAMQQKTYTPEKVDMTTPSGAKPATDADLALYEKHGLVTLDEMGLHGVTDRLRGSGYK